MNYLVTFDTQKYYYPVSGPLLLNGVLIAQGSNDLSEAALQKLKEHPDFDQWIEMGCIEVVEETETTEATDLQPPGELDVHGENESPGRRKRS